MPDQCDLQRLSAGQNIHDGVLRLEWAAVGSGIGINLSSARLPEHRPVYDHTVLCERWLCAGIPGAGVLPARYQRLGRGPTPEHELRWSGGKHWRRYYDDENAEQC